jgi:hypothetical protein
VRLIRDVQQVFGNRRGELHRLEQAGSRRCEDRKAVGRGIHRGEVIANRVRILLQTGTFRSLYGVGGNPRRQRISDERIEAMVSLLIGLQIEIEADDRIRTWFECGEPVELCRKLFGGDHAIGPAIRMPGPLCNARLQAHGDGTAVAPTTSGGKMAEPKSIPSSLDLNRDATAARTGREQLEHEREEHTESSPAVTAGDVDADWQSASFTGDEAPGGDNPTPDQSVTDDIGRAVGLQYQDAEELRAVDKIDERDRRRWELDPASSDDYQERERER